MKKIAYSIPSVAFCGARRICRYIIAYHGAFAGATSYAACIGHGHDTPDFYTYYIRPLIIKNMELTWDRKLAGYFTDGIIPKMLLEIPATLLQQQVTKI